MSKAKYSTEEEGHFGLGFKHYSHFTSPIRRYPDMMAHRMLQHYLDGGKPLPKDEYESLCKHSSEMEKKAAESPAYEDIEDIVIEILNQANKLTEDVAILHLYISHLRCLHQDLQYNNYCNKLKCKHSY